MKLDKAARRAAKRNARRFARGESAELWVDDYRPPTPQPMVGDHVTPWRGGLAKRGGTPMVEPLAPKVKKRSKAKRDARRAAKAAGISWEDIPKDVRKTLIADAKLARAMKKVLGPTPAPEAAPPDTAMVKTVLGSQINVEDAKGALVALRKALATPTVGCSGWRP